jgi:hypothetical protein
MIELEMRIEAERAIERLQKILTSARGAESPALNMVGSARIALLRLDSNWAGVLDERKRMLVRMEKATGPKSVQSLYALRELAWDYPALDNWPDEEGVLLTLREPLLRPRGRSAESNFAAPRFIPISSLVRCVPTAFARSASAA